MVAEAQRSRAPIQRLADRVAGWFVPAEIVVVLLAFDSWAWFGPEPGCYSAWLAISVLIIARPCTLGLATPMSIMVGRGARAGVLIKNVEVSERMKTVDTLVVDKIGTLTEGRPKVVAAAVAAGFPEITARLQTRSQGASAFPMLKRKCFRIRRARLRPNSASRGG